MRCSGRIASTDPASAASTGPGTARSPIIADGRGLLQLLDPAPADRIARDLGIAAIAQRARADHHQAERLDGVHLRSAAAEDFDFDVLRDQFERVDAPGAGELNLERLDRSSQLCGTGPAAG